MRKNNKKAKKNKKSFLLTQKIKIIKTAINDEKIPDDKAIDDEKSHESQQPRV